MGVTLRVLFVYSDISGLERYGGKKYYSGIGSLSAVLKAAGYETSLLYLQRELSSQEFVDQVDAATPDVVAFSSTTHQYPYIENYARSLKNERPGLVLVIGGTHPTLVPDEVSAWGIEPLLRGLVHQRAQEVDPLVVDDVRNFLFGPPGAGGFDLASLNIQRGRDHGLPSLSALRVQLELLPPGAFEDICSDPQTVANLASVYELPGDVDPWVGALAEDHLPGAMVGETLHAVLVEQFRALRDGDRFWYERAFPKQAKRLIERQTLARIIRRNTDIGAEIPRDVFRIRATRR